jgi:uncharacterized membrane protein
LALAVVTGAGAAFSAVSTYDFVQFLDRQVHSIHCGFVPGASAELGDSGCRTAMMSPFSSFFGQWIWGGIPVALWALAVFAFLTYRAALIAWRGHATRQEAGFLLAATGLPVAMSILYFILARQLGTTCKVCVGMYACSAVAFVLAFFALLRIAPQGGDSMVRLAGWFTQGVGFVGVLTGVYLAFHPSAAPQRHGGCGALVQPDDPSRVMLELKPGATSMIEVLDPLCPSCRALDLRLGVSSLSQDLGVKALLFPLDSSCNWMVTEELHPGSCAVSEAILCATGLGEKKDFNSGRRVLSWAFQHQEHLREKAKADPKALRAELEAKFPQIKGCLNGSQVKNKLLKSLRWAVANGLPVLTPQLFVGEKRMCDEDTDLGLEYALREMLSAEPGPIKGAHR